MEVPVVARHRPKLAKPRRADHARLTKRLERYRRLKDPKQSQYPSEWIALEPDGKHVGRGPLENRGGAWQILDMSSPYQEYLAEQTKEILAKFKPVDGIFFDEASTDVSDLPYYQGIHDYVKEDRPGERVVVNTSDRKARVRFAEHMAALHEDLPALFARYGVDTISLHTDIDYVPELRRFFRNRERRLALG